MLTYIKSEYFIEKIFSNLAEDKILKLIVHNKNIQNKLNINLLNYKIFSGKYFVGEKMEQEKYMMVRLIKLFLKEIF